MTWEEKKYTLQKRKLMQTTEQNQSDTTSETKKKSLNAKCCGIYGLKNKTNGKWYVGQSTRSIADRWSSYKNLKCDSQPKLLNAIVKYGYDKFEKIILENCPAEQSILDSREDYWIRFYDSVENGYNCRYGGANGTFSDEAKQKVKDGCKKRNPDKMFIARSNGGKKSKGRTVAESTIRNMKIAQKSRFANNPNELLRMQALSHTASLGKFWIHNNVVCKKIPNGQPIPDGFVKGRFYK